jgi:hypothetical protein
LHRSATNLRFRARARNRARSCTTRGVLRSIGSGAFRSLNGVLRSRHGILNSHGPIVHKYEIVCAGKLSLDEISLNMYSTSGPLAALEPSIEQDQIFFCIPRSGEGFAENLHIHAAIPVGACKQNAPVAEGCRWPRPLFLTYDLYNPNADDPAVLDKYNDIGWHRVCSMDELTIIIQGQNPVSPQI